MLEIGTRVRTRAKRSEGHTRLPRYLQQRDGQIVAVLGRFRFADEAAERGIDARDEMLYTVEFGAEEYTVRADLFESYLEPQA
jgi:hypothetical protein